MARRAWPGAIVLGATLLSLTLALGTRPYVHPDERLHVDAFHYYAAHAWPPAPNASGLRYDPYGTSKVYAREIVYLAFGLPGRWLETAFGIASPVLAYRLLNVALLPLTLAVLLRLRAPGVPGPALALVLACIPQVLYVFSYANSDAWAVCASVLLLAQALRVSELPAPWPLGESARLGLLAGLVLASKDNFFLALALPAVLLWPGFKGGVGRRGLLVFGVSVLLLPLPYKVLYPLLEPDFAAATRRMVEERAAPGFKPSDPSLARPYRDASVARVLVEKDFLVRSAQSAWGVYGHMNVFHGKTVYVLVGLLALSNVGLTALTAVRRWRQLPRARRRMLCAAPAVVLANLALSLAWSIRVFYQPQGRYLFPSLLSVALLIAGTADLEPAWRRPRVAAALVGLGLTAWSLLFLALPRLS